MSERLCPGLPADWLNGWLAAVGATVLVPGLRLAWSDDPVPVARLVASGADDPADLIDSAIPSVDEIERLPIARTMTGFDELPQKEPTIGAWKQRCAMAREHRYSWSLTSLYSDLGWSRKNDQVLEKGQFNTPAPKGLTVHDRVVDVRKKLADGTLSTLEGSAELRKLNGLGFEFSRVASLADDTSNYVNPIVELLAFFALALFPVRVNGNRVRQRCWTGQRSKVGAFSWPAWSGKLDHNAIDALLDLSHTPITRQRSVGVTHRWEVVPMQARSSSDVTRGYGSRIQAGW